mmetsp:Transcript_96203/g.170806  ORF Transcript_96203/g.170806 Transcript_96203/m.170806 type:complete len:705 (+) Transcript_96203:41-2155(+)
MKTPAMVLRLLLLLAVPSCGRLLVARKADEANPVSQVVSLLQDLEKKAEEESDKEKALYEKFACMGKSSTAEKEASVTAAEARVSMLKARDAEIEANKAKLAQEEEKAKKEIADLKAELDETAQKNAATEAAALAKIEQTQKGVEAIRTAVETLTGEDKSSAGLLLKRAGGSLKSASSAASRAKQAADLELAVKIGEQSLSKPDAVFLRSLLTGRVPTGAVRLAAGRTSKATTNAAKARKKDVEEILTGLETKFEKNVEEDKKILKEEHEVHENLEDSKKEQLSSAEESLAKIKSTAANDLQAQAEAKEAIEQLEDQVAADKKYIADTKSSLEEKEKEFDERNKVALDEVAAIGDAIAILRSDEARDTFSKSFSFMQLSNSQGNMLRDQARDLIRQEASARKDARLLGLMHDLRVDASGSFDTVVDKIEKMKTVLETEAEDDLKQRDTCIAQKSKDKAEEQSIGFEIKDIEGKEENLDQEVMDIEREIGTKSKEIAQIDEELEKAKNLRADENKAYLAAKQNDGAALQLLKQATLKLTEVYKKAGAAALLQKRRKKGAGSNDDDFGYKAATTEPSAQATGVIGTMELVSEDLQKSMSLADTEEATAKKLFEENEKDLSAQKEQLQKMEVTLKGSKGEKSKDLAEAQQSLASQKSQLSALEQKMKDAAKSCDFIVDKFDERTENRQAEIAGLDKAKAVLQSAKVS